VAELPFLPIATDAILADTTHMSAEEFGAYCRLLFVMWRHGGQLRDDDTELANVVGLPVKRWAAIKERVTRPMKIADGQLTQKRLTETWERVQVVKVKKTMAANKRWKSKWSAPAMHMHSTSNANHNHNQDITTSSPEPAREAEPDETPQGLGNGKPAKPPHAVSRAELDAILAAKRTH
jgi:uncharacterized protein YdaU (DUF1376 family)